MWVVKAVGLDWEKAQQALKDGLCVRVNSPTVWVHGTEAGPVPVFLDKAGQLITRPPVEGLVLLGAAARARIPSRVGVWKPTQNEIDHADWAAYAWEGDS
jgi:hypothetical protein